MKKLVAFSLHNYSQPDNSEINTSSCLCTVFILASNDSIANERNEIYNNSHHSNQVLRVSVAYMNLLRTCLNLYLRY